MKVHVLFFASAREAVGMSETSVELEEGSSCCDLKKTLEKAFPRLNFSKNHIGLAVNKQYSNDSTILKDNDVVALIPPISGG